MNDRGENMKTQADVKLYLDGWGRGKDKELTPTGRWKITTDKDHQSLAIEAQEVGALGRLAAPKFYYEGNLYVWTETYSPNFYQV